MNKLVSVIVPVYKVEEYLRDCVKSIQEQSYKELEIILVDDGSPDLCPQICEELASDDDRIVVVHQMNEGLSSARNAGLDIAKGEYISFVDSDDAIDVRFIETLYKACEENDCAISQCDYFAVRDINRKGSLKEKDAIEIVDGREALLSDDCANDVNYIVAWNKLYKRELFDGIRYPIGKINEDVFTTWKLLWNARVAYVHAYMYFYRYREDSIMGKACSLERLDAIEAYQERVDFLKNNGYFKEAYREQISCLKHFVAISEQLKISLKNFNQYEEELSKKESEIRNKILEFEKMDACKKEVILQRDLENVLSNSSKAEYVFPFSKIPKEATIVIYGAGRVGKEYYRQLTKMGYCKKIIWVDTLSLSGNRNIKSIDYIIQDYTDYIVIAVERKTVAEKIKKTIMKFGITEDRIIWDNPIVPTLEMCEQQNMQREELIKNDDERKFFLMNTADHGNVGDHAIAIAAHKYLNDYFANTKLYDITGMQWDMFQTEIKQVIKKQDVIFIVGGGFMGSLWPVEDTRVKDIVQSFPDNKIIFLPQTFYYDYKNVDNSYIQKEKMFYKKNTNVMCIHREKFSLNSFEENILRSECRNRLYPDLVLYLEENSEQETKTDVLLCFRKDKEKRTNNRTSENIKRILEENELSYTEIDTVVSRSIYKDNRDVEYKEKLKSFASAKLVITDRLHGMLFAVISGVPCIALDNLSHKIKGVYEWISNLPSVECLNEEEVSLEYIMKLYNMERACGSRDKLIEQFEKMAIDIKSWYEV